MILVTGATGFIGGHMMAHLRDSDQPVRALVRPGAPRDYLEKRGVEVVEGDVTEPLSLPAAVQDVESVIHLVGIIRERPGVTFPLVVAEGTRNLVDAAAQAGVRRFVYVSAIGANPNGVAAYQRMKWAAETFVREATQQSDLEHVIIRPSVVYGPGDELVSMFSTQAVPLPGGGHSRLQPLFVQDLVQVLAQATQLDAAADRTFEIGGPQVLTWRRFAQVINSVTGRNVPHPPLPLPLATAGAAVMERLTGPLHRFGYEPPLTRDQLAMMLEDNTCDNLPVLETFDVSLTPLVDGLASWLAPTRRAA